MIVALIISLLLDGAWFVHWVAHHRTGLAAAAIGAAGYVAHRTRRQFVHTGKRVAGMPPLPPKPKGVAA